MIRTPHTPMHVAAVTHPGMGGKQNEDRFAVSSYQVANDDATQSAFAIISDGIGGHSAGEVAAEMAVESISRMVARSTSHQPLGILDHAIRATSDAIAAKAKDNSQRLGMGTTCACAWVIGNRLFTASVGDSRIYLLRNGRTIQLTIDHTWVQEALDKGILNPQEAHSHPNVHVIRRYLGSPQTPRADTRLRLAADESDTQSRSNQGLRLRDDDLILLCTDGLTDVVENAEIEPAVRGLDPQAAAQALVDLACSRNAADNITVVLLRFTGNRMLPEDKDNQSLLWALSGLIGFVLLAFCITELALLVLRFILPLAP